MPRWHVRKRMMLLLAFVRRKPCITESALCAAPHHTQYHHRHLYLQVCHVAHLLLYRRLWLAFWWWVCCFLRFVAPCIIIIEQPPLLLGLALRHATRAAATCVVYHAWRVRMAPLANGVAGFVVRLEIDLTLIRPPSSLPPSPTTCTVCLLPPSSITTTNNHESMMLRLATKAGTMAGRRGAHPNLGKVACV